MGQEESRPGLIRTRPHSPEVFERNVRRRVGIKPEQNLTSNGDVLMVDSMRDSGSSRGVLPQPQQLPNVVWPPQHLESESTAFGVPNDVQLTLAHLLQDGPGHPLYQYRLDNILDGLVGSAALDAVICKPFRDLCTSDAMIYHPNVMETVDIKTKLAKGLLQKVIHDLGGIIGVIDGEHVRIEAEMQNHRLSFQITPIFEVADGTNVVLDLMESGSDVDSTGDEFGAGTRNVLPQTPGLTFTPFGSNDNEKKTLLLGDPDLVQSKTSKQRKEMLNRATQKVGEALSKLRPHGAPKPPKRELTISEQGYWIITFAKKIDVNAYVNQSVMTSHGQARFNSVHDSLAQIFRCRKLPPDIDYDEAVLDLLAAMPDRQVYVAKGRLAEREDHVYVVLKKPINAKQFTLLMKRSSGTRHSATFTGLYNDGANCRLCNSKHRTDNCDSLVAVQLQGQRLKGLLTRCPAVPPKIE